MCLIFKKTLRNNNASRVQNYYNKNCKSDIFLKKNFYLLKINEL